MTFAGAHHCRPSVTTSISILVAAMLAVGCMWGLPSSSQSGKVQDIVIGSTVTPSEITLAPGDEVRWTNRQRGASRHRIFELGPGTGHLRARLWARVA